MVLLLDSFWRAAAYCLHRRVILLSLLPLLAMGAASLALGYWFWDQAVAGVMAWLDAQALSQLVLGWLESVGAGAFRHVLGGLLVLTAAVPLVVFASLLLVAWTMTPAMVALVAQRRFPALERRRGGSFIGSLAWSLGSFLLALLALLLSVPLWWIPPLVLVLPPLIWGWLAYRVFAYDALAEHASLAERRRLLREHRGRLLLMGLVAGLLGAAPSLLWASGAMFIAMAPLLVPLAVWVYTLVFAFASLWFAHYLLAALAAHRGQAPMPERDDAPQDQATTTTGAERGAAVIPGPESVVIDVEARRLP